MQIKGIILIVIKTLICFIIFYLHDHSVDLNDITLNLHYAFANYVDNSHGNYQFDLHNADYRYSDIHNKTQVTMLRHGNNINIKKQYCYYCT